MKNIIKVFISFAILFSLFACEKDFRRHPDNIQGYGDMASQEIYVPDFNEIENIGIASIDFVKGYERKIIIRAQENILDYIICNVINQKLVISFEDNVNISSPKDIVVEIINPELKSISSVGTGNIKLNGIQQESLYITNTGTGHIDAFYFEVDNCYITLTGTGSCNVTVHNYLDVIITGIGNVYYRGYPNIHQQITGLGRIVSVN